MIKIYFKLLKAFLALEVSKVSFLITLIFDIYIKFSNLLFFDFLNLDKFLIVLSTLLLLFLTILLSPTLGACRVKSDNLVVFNIEINNIAILLKAWIKHQ